MRLRPLPPLASQGHKHIGTISCKALGDWAIRWARAIVTVRPAAQGCAIVEEIAKPEFKARMTVRLAVAGAFHTAYMAPAVEALTAALAAAPIAVPRIPVISNVDAKPHSDPDTIRSILARQVWHACRCMLWHRSVCLAVGSWASHTVLVAYPVGRDDNALSRTTWDNTLV
jgi:hypothetical protein